MTDTAAVAAELRRLLPQAHAPYSGVHVAAAVEGADGRLRNGALPPGTYATLVHTGPLAGLRDAARALLEWGEANGVAWHRRDESRAERWEARVEAWLGDPAAEPDPAHWRTEISFLTKED